MSKQSRQKSPKTAGSKKAAAASPKPAAKRPAAKAKTSAKVPAVRQDESSHKPAAKALRTVTGDKTAQAGLTEGAKAPAFKLPRDGGATIDLKSFAGRKLVIFFYPRAGTPGCTREAIDFTRLGPQFDAAGVSVLGVSADPPAAQERFRDKHGLTTPLASDTTHAMLEDYGAWGEKSLYGKKFMGILRTTVLIGTDGRVARIWRKVKVEGHAEAVLAAARAV